MKKQKVLKLLRQIKQQHLTFNRFFKIINKLSIKYTISKSKLIKKYFKI